jgi:hypothetical protein
MKQDGLGRSIVPYGVYPEKHEYETAEIFLKLGIDVEFIKPQNTKQATSPDVIIKGVAWEMKSPTGKGKYTIQNQFRRAAKQSSNLIFDIRRLQLPEDFAKQEIEKQFNLRRSIKRLKLIIKSGAIIEFRK